MGKIKPYIQVFPVVFIIAFVFFVGIFGAFIQSLGYFPIIGMNEISLKYYMEIFSNDSFMKNLIFTLYTTGVSSIISILLGIILSVIIISLNTRGEIVFKLPIIIPHIVVALFAITFLSDSGVFSRIFYHLGFSNAEKIFSNILFSENGLGIIISYIWKETPYVILTVISILKNISGKHELIAINLGASKFYAFRRVTLPMLLPTIISTFTIIFSFSFGAYEIPFLLGATVPKTLPIQAFLEYQNPLLSNRPLSMAINMIIVVFCVIFVFLFNYIIKRVILGVNYE